MAVRAGVGSYLEQDRANGAGPKHVYLALSGGVYSWHVGSAGAADAVLKDKGAGVFVLDDDVAERDRTPYLVGTSTVIL